MSKNPPLSLKDAIYKLQLSLLDGIHNENQLFAAGSLFSKSDYEDVVTERSISNICGYPLCNNPLPSDQPRKGRYRISLKEHKVYDLTETRMYCSSGCVINSRAFASSLQSDRCSVSDSKKISEVLRLFGELGLEDKENLGKKGDLGLSDLSIGEKMDLDLGFSNLSIKEKSDVMAGEVSLRDWIGPSNAIEGYVPQRDRISSPLDLQRSKKGSRPKQGEQWDEDIIGNETDFMSNIVIGDSCSVQKTSAHKKSSSEPSVKKLKGKQSVEKTAQTNKMQLKSSVNPHEAKTAKVSVGKSAEGNGTQMKSSLKSSGAKIVNDSVEKTAEANETQLKPSLKSSGTKALTRNVTWADEKKVENTGDGKLCDYREIEEKSGIVNSSVTLNEEDASSSLRRASAEACAVALSQAAEAVASGEIDVVDAVSEAGIVILPPTHGVEGNSSMVVDAQEPEQYSGKWPTKPMFLDTDMFNSDDSWHDTPPESFSLTLSSFATMWMALFGWVSTSSLAYIYGRDGSSEDDFMSINGREYPHKIVVSDGRSSEIKQTLAGCIARALPGLVADLRIPTPISTLEQAMGRLLETMSFVDALPPFRIKQWHVIILLFIDALSVRRIPALTPHMASKRTLLHKVLDAAQISGEEYEAMKDLLIPLGRLPEFSAQSGG